jgi:hypothetical protein
VAEARGVDYKGPIGSPWSSRYLGVVLVAVKRPETERTICVNGQQAVRGNKGPDMTWRMEDLLFSLGRPEKEIQDTLPREE